MTKKSAVETEDQDVNEASASAQPTVDDGEKLEYEEMPEQGAVEPGVTPENQIIDAAAMNGELPKEEQDHAASEVSEFPQGKKKRAKRQAVMPEGYTLEASAWEQVFQAMKRNYTVAALIVAIDYPDGRPAWELTFRDYQDIRGVVPAGETDLADPALMQQFVGQPISVKIKGLDRESRLAACSRREAVAENRARLFESVQAGDMLECKVKAVLPWSEEHPEQLLVDVGGGVLAKVSRRKATMKLTQRLSQQYAPGQVVMASVARIEPQNGIIEVSLVGGNAWDRVDFKRGQPISGTIITIKGDNCYIEPDACPGVLGIATLPIWGEFRRNVRVACKVVNFVGAAHKLRLYISRRLA